MSATSIFTGCLFFLGSTLVCVSQPYDPPAPVMSKIILADFIKLHFVYPKPALERHIEGTVRIHFETDKEGKVIHRLIRHSVSPEIDSASLELFDLICWRPAREYGIAVAGSSDFDLTFKVKKYKRMVQSRGFETLPISQTPADKSGKIYALKELIQKPQAILPEGYDQLTNFIYANISYPSTAQKLNISGTVKLRFVIETNGLPSNIVVEEAVGGGCSEEAVAVIQQLRWNPGLHEGEAVRTKYELFIQFNPGINDKYKYIPAQHKTGL